MRWLPAALLLTAGCAPAFQTRAPDVRIMPARIAVVPAFTLAYELGFNSNPKPVETWADAMADSLDPEIERRVVGFGGHVFPESDTMMVPVVYRKFRKWSTAALAEMAAQKTNRADFKMYAVDKWAFEENLAKVREMLQADFVLITLFKDTRRTAGHVVGNALMGVHTYYLQVGAAGLVDLRDGRMVWCNAKADAWQDLSQAAVAKAAVAELLTDLYYQSKSGAPH
jgi:hypothetical protein